MAADAPLEHPPHPLEQGQLRRIADYCRDHWDASTREGVTKEWIEPVPFKHTVPCISGNFIALFYWDTYFTNLGLLRQDRVELARSNCDALLYLIGQKGFVPNSTFKGDDTRSQPPYLSMMVREVYEITRDRAWLGHAVPLLETEYRFWMAKRNTPLGLNRHFHSATDDYLLRFYDSPLIRRVHAPADAPREERLRIAAHRLAEAEAGCDFTDRFDGRCADFVSLDLNVLLYRYEENFAWFANELGRSGGQAWQDLAQARVDRINRFLWDESAGLFRDYDFVNGRPSAFAGLVTFAPLWAGLASPAQAARVRDQLPRFERAFGPAMSEERTPASPFQWDYPNGWPPFFWITASALDRYGFRDDARRIAAAYGALAVRHFERTGQLWEKFDVTTGEIAGGEYEAQPMMGWSAGVFLACLELLGIDTARA